MESFILIIGSLLVLDVFISCEANPFVSQLQASHHSSFHHVFRRSSSQRYLANENPLGNFEIRRNTIIRTQDSRAMGAEYLNEMQKQSNDECLMWCLEHPRCNVAVFEEKNNRSCYLFDCGPLSDFRCNFTSYSYYVSSVMRGTHHPFDLKQWQSQARHESDLANLRKPPPQQPTAPSELLERTSMAPPTPPPPPRSAEASVDETKANQRESIEEQPMAAQWTPGPSCQHYQFQCRSNKDCIAIYNVCDGIPQCPDGSDEGKDLQCPQAEEPNKTTLLTTPPATPPPPTPTLPPTEPPRPQPMAPQAPEKPSHNRLPSYHHSRPDDIPIVDDSAGPMYGLQDNAKGEAAWAQYQQQALANAQQDEYVAPVKDIKPSHSGYSGQHVLFPNKHSSFHPASGVNYRPNLYQNTNSNNNQWNTDYYNSDSYEPPPPPPSPPRGSPTEMEYSGPYENSFRNHGSSNNNFRMGPLKVGGNSPQPFDHYRPINPYWTAEEKIPNKGGYVKSEGDVPLIPEMSRQQVNSHLSQYNEAMSGPARYNEALSSGPSTYQQPLPPSNAYSLSKPSYPQSMESGQSYMPAYQSQRPAPEPKGMSNRRPVVQPQVQNDGGQEDAIYDPQAEVPRGGGMVDSDVPHQHQNIKQSAVPSVTFQPTSLPATTTTTPKTEATKKPVAAKNSVPHAQIHGVSHSHKSQVSAEAGMTLTELQQANRVHAHESNGAVLALTLGLAITAILVVLVGCRLRNLRRRLARRGGRSSLAHDADYLVNGMYL